MKWRKIALAVVAFLGVAVICGHLVRARSGDKRGSLRVDDRDRTYTLHVPSDYDGTHAVPLVLALHGRLGKGSGEEKLAHLDKVSEEHNFLVVYPDGVDRSWADGRGGTPADKKGVDDVKFLSSLVDKMAREYKVDDERIYAAGMSNGGFMSGRLACDLSNRIAAVGIVAASLSESVAANCRPRKPVSVLILQGTEDPLVPIQGGALERDAAGGVVLSHANAVQKFVQLNLCSTSPRKDHVADKAGDGTTIDIAIYTGCLAGSEVRSYVVNGGGHTWPDGMQYLPSAIIGKTTHNLDGSEVIWSFLSQHTR